MAEYIVEVAPNLSLPQVELAIQGEEATGAEFLRASISFHENAITNLVTFNDLPPGQRPNPLVVFVKHGVAAPSGKASIWAGVVVVAGSNQAIVAYR